MKELIESMGWLSKSLVLSSSMVLFTVMVTSLALRGVKTEVTIAWWMASVAVGIVTVSAFGGAGLVTNEPKQFVVGLVPIAIVVFAGLTFGTIMNTFYGQAVQSAPNPALAMAVINSSTLFLYILAPVLHKLMPKVFAAASINTVGLVGVVLTLVGLILITKSK
jgi:hypothetical protein